MKKQLLEAIHEMEGRKIDTIEDALQEYSKEDILDIWLRYEGIVGYTSQILSAINSMRI